MVVPYATTINKFEQNRRIMNSQRMANSALTGCLTKRRRSTALQWIRAGFARRHWRYGYVLFAMECTMVTPRNCGGQQEKWSALGWNP